MKIKSFVPNSFVKETDKHHLFPKSRYFHLRDKKSNQVMLPKNIHDNFHKLFTNRNPYECLAFLVNVIWGGRIQFVEEFLRMYNRQKEKEVI